VPCSAIGLLIIEATRVEIVASIMSTEVGCVKRPTVIWLPSFPMSTTVCPQLNMESASRWSKADKPNTTSTSKATATFLMTAGLLV
jgi:hypothetical protein